MKKGQTRTEGRRAPLEGRRVSPTNSNNEANFWELVVEPIDGTQDPRAHLQAFQTQIDALALRRPSSMEEIRTRAEKHVKAEEDKEDHLLA
ncbi:hypothetical protein CR513_25937, partial [Mucuna pruriens]